MPSIFDNARAALGRLAAAAGAPAPDGPAARTADSFQNVGARLGLGTDNQTSGGMYGYSTISRNRVNLDNAYRGSWLVGMSVDAPADDMTKAGIEYTGDIDPADAERMINAYVQLRLWHQLGNTIRWARLYGGAIAVMLIDGQDVSTPFRPETVRKGQFKGLLVLDRWMVNPSLTDLIQDFGPDFGAPRFYTVNVNPQQDMGGTGGGVVAQGGARPVNNTLTQQRIHYTRVLRFDGSELPFFARQQENGWGQSVIERLYDRLVAFDSATTGAAQLVYKAHLRTIKIKGLREISAIGGKALDGLISSLNFMRRWQSNEGLTVLDGEDEFDVHSYAFNGIPELLSQFAEQVSGAVQIPVVRLFGQSPAGFSTGETDLQNYYDMIGTLQNAKLRPNLERLNGVLARSELGRDLPDGVGFRFVPLWQMTATEKSDVATKVTAAVTQAESSGLISRKVALEELRQSSAVTGVFTNISDEDIDEAERDPPAPSELDPPQQQSGGVPGSADPDDTENRLNAKQPRRPRPVE